LRVHHWRNGLKTFLSRQSYVGHPFSLCTSGGSQVFSY
jgi:hypothetical protein